ncbi:SusC/RagA family TonB-linked outer membrane protein [Arenibacter latericius]|uniref:SusC/RagA family TonB-linked outer membrane protein n=1 Tax=Arenibacter latericius TaxID=86104 RepID=UPI00040BC396|nr:TonB-dependent receptor [Arenibacter latericius]
MLSLGVYAQEIEITGKVISSDGTALPGVNIIQKGTVNGVVTDFDGIYRIRIIEGSNILVFSYIGFQTLEQPIGDRSEINITLIEEAEQLGEVVIVGFGSQKKETVTGAISSVKTKEVKQSPAANMAITLAGRLPGLTSIQRTGQPGAENVQLLIRGQGTVNTQSPLILVDGVERELNFIDPNEVESITVLKDASSTAIFGVKGANGVVLVTTRRGNSEIPEINFSSESSFSDLPRFISPVNSFQYATLRNLSLANDGLPEEFSANALEHYRLQDDPLRYPDTDWRSILMKDYSFQQRYNLNISGAGEKAKYFINGGYVKQGGQFKTEKDLPYNPSFELERYNFRSNADVKLTESLKAFLNVAGYLQTRNAPYALGGDDPTDWIIYFMNRLPATVPGPLTPDDGVITDGDVAWPAYGLLNRSGFVQTKESNVLASFGMEQQLDFITKGLSAKAILSFDTKSINRLEAQRSHEKFVQVIDNDNLDDQGLPSVSYRLYNNDKNTPLSISGRRAFASRSNFQAFLNYNRTFGKHATTGMLLFQKESLIIDEQLPFNSLGTSARFTYGYDNKYFMELNAGYNGSEQFAKNNRYGFFPAVSAGYVLSNESFWKEWNGKDVVNLLKVRGSFGKVGNDRVSSSRFLFLDDIKIAGGGFSGSLGDGNTIITNLLKNEDLQWEVAKKTNVGIELGLFHDFTVNADFFYERRDNILRFRGIIPVLNGLPNQALAPVNIGVISNKGYELELNYRKAFSKDLSLLARANLNHSKNKQLFADEAILPEDFAYRFRETGYKIGQQFGYVVDRYFLDEEDINSSPEQVVGGHESRPGDFKYKDLNGDGVVNEKDIAPIGYSNVPEYQFGLAFNITYKNFDISALFQGVGNVSNYISGEGAFATNGVNNFISRHLNSYTPERAANGDEISYPRLSLQNSPNEIRNSFFIVNTGYVRLKSAELGYSLPSELTRRLFNIQRIRIYTNGLNLITWDNLPTKEFDPELRNSRSFPITRTFNLGVNITF